MMVALSYAKRTNTIRQARYADDKYPVHNRSSNYQLNNAI